MKKYLLPENGNFYKANMHCHSVISDGTWTPEEIKRNYMEHGYSIVAYTDHDVMIPHHDLTDENFLALTGYEMEINEKAPDKGPRQRKTCHMCLVALSPEIDRQVCWHRSEYVFGNANDHVCEVKFDESLPDYERVYTGECISDMMKKGRDAGFFVTYNHPVWSLENYPEYINYHGMNAMEIVNYGCISAGWYDYNPKVYDEFLMEGRRIFCIGGDDNHNRRINDSFGGFTVIKAERLEYRAVADALLAGNFYASQGPEIKALWVEDGKVHIECSPVCEICLNTGVRKAARVEAAPGESLTEAEFDIDPSWVYIRLTATDHAGKPANTNAYFIDEMELAAE